MLSIFLCAFVIFAATDVHGRYLYESTIHGSIETNKIISPWEDALAQCTSEGAVLAAPLNEQLRNDMMALISVNNHSTPYFINAKIVHSHKLQFVSSEGVSLDDMSVSDMIDELDPREGDCLAMDAHTIRVVSCSMPLPYMCYKESDTISTTTEQVIEETTTELNTPCGTTDKGYQLNPTTGSCYKYHSESKNWDDASATCKAEGGFLVILNDKQEAQVVHDMGLSFIFIGIRDLEKNYKGWTSVHGDPLDSIYNEFHDGHVTLHNEFCGSIFGDGRLETFQCDLLKPFLCEKYPPSSHNYNVY